MISMRSINVFFYGDQDFLKKLGKLGSHSDIALYNRKQDQNVFTFITPLTYPEKIQPMIQAASMANTAIIEITELTPELGEVIVTLSLQGIEQGIIILENIIPEQIKPLIKDTPLEKYTYAEKSYASVIEELKKTQIEEKKGSLRLSLDHFFLTKTIGTVGVGRIERGEIKKHQKLKTLPLGKEVVVKSLQVQDINTETATSDTRVGVALKGIDVDELKRGTILTDKPDDYTVSNTLKGSFTQHRYFKQKLEKGQRLQIALGLQTETVIIKKIETNKPGENIRIEVETENGKKLAYEENERFLLTRPEVKGLRIAGNGRTEAQ